MRCPQPDTNADKCHVQERHTADTTIIMVPKFSFPHHFWRVPRLFLTSLMGIAYACGASFRQNPMSSGFNESEKGGTRCLFMFREFEKTAEK